MPTSQSLPTSSGSPTTNVIPTPTYYEISDNENSLRDMFPQLYTGQEAMLLELYNNNIHEVIEALLDGIN